MKKEYFLIANSFKELTIKVIENEHFIWDGTSDSFEDEYTIIIWHEDGSEFKIKHGHYRWGKVGENDCLIVFPEHNSNMIFAVCDLEYFIINDFKNGSKFLVCNGKQYIGNE